MTTPGVLTCRLQTDLTTVAPPAENISTLTIYSGSDGEGALSVLPWIHRLHVTIFYRISSTISTVSQAGPTPDTVYHNNVSFSSVFSLFNHRYMHCSFFQLFFTFLAKDYRRSETNLSICKQNSHICAQLNVVRQNRQRSTPSKEFGVRNLYMVLR